MNKIKPTLRPVVVTTEFRGIFFGYATDTTGDTIKLERMRVCVWWSKGVKGFVGLAATGPTDDCQISPAADGELRKITSVLEAKPDAVTAWEKAPWKQ